MIVRLLAVLAFVFTIAGCTATERGAATGAGVGAIVGGVATGNVRGAAVGAAIGGTAGALIGRSRDRRGWCVYEDRRGRRYEARCS